MEKNAYKDDKEKRIKKRTRRISAKDGKQKEVEVNELEK